MAEGHLRNKIEILSRLLAINILFEVVIFTQWLRGVDQNQWRVWPRSFATQSRARNSSCTQRCTDRRSPPTRDHPRLYARRAGRLERFPAALRKYHLRLRQPRRRGPPFA